MFVFIVLSSMSSFSHFMVPIDKEKFKFFNIVQFINLFLLKFFPLRTWSCFLIISYMFRCFTFLIFICSWYLCMVWSSNQGFFFLHMNIQFIQHQLLKKILLSHYWALGGILSLWKLRAYVLENFLQLFHWYIPLFSTSGTPIIQTL